MDEIAPPHLSPGITLFNARSKAHAISRNHPKALVIGVDTVVSFEGEVFGKPANMDEAVAMLRRLNGRAHEVYSGVWLRHDASGKERGFIDITRVHFQRLTEPQLRAYLNRIRPARQARRICRPGRQRRIDRPSGRLLSNVTGLPMEALAKALKEFNG